MRTYDQLHELYDTEGLDAVIARVFEDAHLLGQTKAGSRTAFVTNADMQAYLTVVQDDTSE